MVPYLDRPVGRAGQKDLRMESVPDDRVDGHVMSVIGLQELVRVGFRALVDFAFFGADQEDVVLLLVEVEARATAERGDQCSLLML